MGQDQGNLYLLNKRKLRPKVCRFFRYFYKFDSKNDHQLLKSTIFDLKSVCALTLSRMRGSGGQKNPFNSFSSVTSPKDGICTQNILTFSFNPFVTLLQSATYLLYAFSHVINFCWWSHGQNLWRHNLYCNILVKPRVACFVDIVKIAIMLIKITLKEPVEVKRIANFCSENFHLSET